MDTNILLDRFPFDYLGDMLRAWHAVRGTMAAVPSAEDLRAMAAGLIATSLESGSGQARPDYGFYVDLGADGEVSLAFTPFLVSCSQEDLYGSSTASGDATPAAG